MSLPTPADEPLSLSDELVAALVFEQFPALAGREIGRHYRAHDLVAVRVGDDYGVILPTVPGQDDLYARAAELLRTMLPRWRFPASAPIATGKPDHGYPYHWVLVNWISASTAALVPLQEDSPVLLGSALHEIHAKAPSGAPPCPTTAVTLASVAHEWQRRLGAVAAEEAPENRVLDVSRADALFARAAAAPIDVAPTWTHGTLNPRTILSDRGHFAGLLVWHRFGYGDPAADLGSAANLVPASQREGMLRAYGRISRATALRAQGWQLLDALRLIQLNDPYLVRTAWERLIEFDVANTG